MSHRGAWGHDGVADWLTDWLTDCLNDWRLQSDSAKSYNLTIKNMVTVQNWGYDPSDLTRTESVLG
jgi:hypothetical protein